MKLRFKVIVSVFLSVLILITGSGVSLAKMVCLKSGYTQITLNTPDECCKHEHEHAPVTIEEKCCDISNVNVDILHYIVSASQHIGKSVVWTFSPETLSFADFSRLYNATRENYRSYIFPPELSSPPLRVFTKTFLI
jgi:hypothetical protein